MKAETDLQNRKGARRRSEIPPEVLNALNKGKLATVNLVEWLAVDDHLLLASVLKEAGVSLKAAEIIPDRTAFKELGVMKRLTQVGSGLAEWCAKAEEGEALAKFLAGHHSDIVRSWACFAVAVNGYGIKKRLAMIRPFAADPHFNVREMAWLVVRPAIAVELERSLDIFSDWVKSGDENIRRFASEATRPRGVWCAHIARLKEEPELGLPLLEPLKSDPSKYVRDSVGNWLNDAGKSQPDWVRTLCKRWEKESKTPETSYTVRRALRNL